MQKGSPMRGGTVVHVAPLSGQDGPLLQKINLKDLIPKRYAIAQSYITLWAMSRNIVFRFVSHLLYLIPKIPYGIHLAPTSP